MQAGGDEKVPRGLRQDRRDPIEGLSERASEPKRRTGFAAKGGGFVRVYGRACVLVEDANLVHACMPLSCLCGHVLPLSPDLMWRLPG